LLLLLLTPHSFYLIYFFFPPFFGRSNPLLLLLLLGLFFLLTIGLTAPFPFCLSAASSSSSVVQTLRTSKRASERASTTHPREQMIAPCVCCRRVWAASCIETDWQDEKEAQKKKAVLSPAADATLNCKLLHRFDAHLL